MTTTALAPWRKSSRSGGGDNCVEIATSPTLVAVRDSKDPGGPTLTFTATSWTTFVTAAARDNLRP